MRSLIIWSSTHHTSAHDGAPCSGSGEGLVPVPLFSLLFLNNVTTVNWSFSPPPPINIYSDSERPIPFVRVTSLHFWRYVWIAADRWSMRNIMNYIWYHFLVIKKCQTLCCRWLTIVSSSLITGSGWNDNLRNCQKRGEGRHRWPRFCNRHHASNGWNNVVGGWTLALNYLNGKLLVFEP